MSLRAATCLALLCLYAASTLGQAQELPVATTTPMVIVPVGSYSADEVAATLNLAFANEAEMSFTSVPSRSMVIVRCPQERRDEVLQTIESLTPPINPIWVRVMQLQTTGDFSAQERARLSGPVMEVAQTVDELRKSGRLQLVHDAEMTLLPDIEGRLQMGEQVAIPMGSTRGQMAGNREAVQYQAAQVGTILAIEADSISEAVELQVNFESSFLRDFGPSANGTTSPSHVGIATLSLKSTLKIPSGQALLVGGMSSNGSAESASQILFVVAAEVISR